MEPVYAEIIPRRRKFIDTSEFSANDLNTFVESLETLTRIARERQQRRQNRRNKNLNITKLAVEVEVHPTPKSEATINKENREIDENLLKAISPKKLRCKLFASETDVSAGHSSDENYFSGASRSESPTDSIQTEGIVALPSTDSGTESESGAFQIRPRSFVMTSPKYRTTRARIIGLVLKKEYADGGSQDELEKQERRERVLEGLLREKEQKCESLRATLKDARKPIPGKDKTKQPTAEMRFIDKALRYLTL